MRIMLLIAVGLSIAACGIKRPLVAPRDIPAYEQKRLDKLRRLEESAPAADPETPRVMLQHIGAA